MVGDGIKKVYCWTIEEDHSLNYTQQNKYMAMLTEEYAYSKYPPSEIYHYCLAPGRYHSQWIVAEKGFKGDYKCAICNHLFPTKIIDLWKIVSDG